MASEIITCVLCGQDRPGSLEHVIPRWARKQLRISSPVTTTAQPSGKQRENPVLNALLRRSVCEDCNGGWMHDLEDAVRPFLSPMLVNAGPAVLDARQQRDLARWAVMKVLLLELSMRQRLPGWRAMDGYTASTSELAWLSAKDEPPPRSRVWLGALDAENQRATSTQAKLFKADVPDGGAELDAHLTTLTVGYVLFQVFSIDFSAATSWGLPEFQGQPPRGFRTALSRIWPQERPLANWPPENYVPLSLLDNITRWE